MVQKMANAIVIDGQRQCEVKFNFSASIQPEQKAFYFSEIHLKMKCVIFFFLFYFNQSLSNVQNQL